MHQEDSSAIDAISCQTERLTIREAKRHGLVLLFSHRLGLCRDAEQTHLLPDLLSLVPGLLNVKKLAPHRAPLVARLTFCDWSAAVNAVLALWELRLQGFHRLTPELPDDETRDAACKCRLDCDLKSLFLRHLAELSTGESVQSCQLELETLRKELLRVQKSLKLLNSVDTWSQLTAAKQEKLRQIQMLSLQLSEYLNGLKAIELALFSHSSEGDEDFPDGFNDETLLFRLGNAWSWDQLYCLIQRETRRFHERLPLYAKRSEILSHIYNNQVMVLVGETGSGKSTQLVQYMVDAGFVKDGFSIACTQPRKVAVMSISDRVAEQSKGCHGLGPLVGHLTSNVFQAHSFSKVMYVTDHILLQLFLSDNTLSQFCCVVVDEAHERSLNTDLLLAFLKQCVSQRLDLKVIIMSATADAALLSRYFGGCVIYRVVGRTFPVQLYYEPDEEEDLLDLQNRQGHPRHGRHVLRVVQKVASINGGSEGGDVLAFLTSQAEVEWACSQHFSPSAVVLPLHGRLPREQQQSVFKVIPSGMRKIVFATNVAETSLTIPGIKFVVDCGLAKESYVDPKSGMNILKVCRIDRSAAMQRAGRAGRMQAGVCYRLYSMQEFEDMAPHRTPEILRVHLGVAILKLLALGVQKVESFDFIDSPNPAAVSLAVKYLCQLGAVVETNGMHELTTLGWQLTKLGVDPRLGSVVLKCASQGLGREGLVIGGLLSCSDSIFFRAGTDDEKTRSDCLKMRFCHIYGDIFTLLCVYQEWDTVAKRNQNKWCFENSINAKSMRRCQDNIRDMEWCLKNDLQLEITPVWSWSLTAPAELYVKLRKILFHCMSTNLAVFSGHECVGYDVITLQKQAVLHPSSSLLVFGHSPTWVVFGEILCTSREYLTSVTVVEPEWISEIEPPLPYDVHAIESVQMKKSVIPGLSTRLLGRICGRSNRNLKYLTKIIRQGGDQRCILEPDYEKKQFHIYATLDLMERAQTLLLERVNQEKRWIKNECIEKCLFRAAPGKSSPVMLFGAGAEIRQLLMQGEFVSVEIWNVDAGVEDKELLKMFDKCTDGIANVHRDPSPENCRKIEKWGVVTFCSVRGAEEAVSLLHGVIVGHYAMEVRPLRMSNPSDKSRIYFPSVKATLSWPRRQRKGYALVGCTVADRDVIIKFCSGVLIAGSRILCRQDRLSEKVFIRGLQADVTEEKLQQVLQDVTGCTLEDVYMPRFPAINQPSVEACEASLVQELKRFMPAPKFHVYVREPEAKDKKTMAYVKFDEHEHEGAASAIAYLQGKSLPVCEPWQVISCKESFFSSLRCPGSFYSVLEEDISDLILALQQQNEGVELCLTKTETGGCFVKIYGDSLCKVAGCKSALEKLIEGVPVNDVLDESMIRLLVSRDGLRMMKSVELQTRTYIACDKRTHTVKVFGPLEKKNRALKKLVRNLSQLKEQKKCYEIHLRGEGRPYGLMKEVVRQCGIDLVGLRMLVPGAWLSLNHRRHALLVRGSKEEHTKVESKIEEATMSLKGSCGDDVCEPSHSENCGICLCEIEDKYSLVGCDHDFCRACLAEQIMSSVRHREGFPIACMCEGCSQQLLIADFEALLTADQQDELQKASLSAFVSSSKGKYRFCTTPDCPAVYRVSHPGELFDCGACCNRLCTSCHVEFHSGLTCDQYREFKQDPDLSLKAWRKGKQHVKCCPSCGSTIEKVDGCNHVLCNCKMHLCWLCLDSFQSSEDCYSHLQAMHGGYSHNDERFGD